MCSHEELQLRCVCMRLACLDCFTGQNIATNWCSSCNRSKSEFIVQAQLPPVLLSIYSVCLGSLFGLLQGAVESTTPWYNLILHRSERIERKRRRVISAVAGWSWKEWKLTIIPHGQHGNVQQDKLFPHCSGGIRSWWRSPSGPAVIYSWCLQEQRWQTRRQNISNSGLNVLVIYLNILVSLVASIINTVQFKGVCTLTQFGLFQKHLGEPNNCRLNIIGVLNAGITLVHRGPRTSPPKLPGDASSHPCCSIGTPLLRSGEESLISFPICKLRFDSDTS